MTDDKGPNSVDRRNSQVPALAEAPDEFSIVDRQPTERRLSHAALGQEAVDLGKEVRLNVHVSDHNGMYPRMSMGYIPRDKDDRLWDNSHMDQIEIIRENVRRLMKTQKLSASELSGKANLAPGYVSELLRKKRKSENPRIDHLRRLSEALGVQIFELLLRPDDPRLAAFALSYVEQALRPGTSRKGP